MAYPYPDGNTLTGLATLVAALFAGVVSLINAFAGWRANKKLVVQNKNLAAQTTGVANQLADVHTDVGQAVSNTNGQLTSIQAENAALRATNVLLQDQIAKLTPRPNRSTDPVQATSVQAPPSGSITIAAVEPGPGPLSSKID